jgi:hypothetical protein
MVNAVVTRGMIRPLDPLPDDWLEGQPVRVEKVDEGEPTAEEIDRDYAELEALCATSDPTDEAILARALAEQHRESKEWMRRRMGLA